MEKLIPPLYIHEQHKSYDVLLVVDQKDYTYYYASAIYHIYIDSENIKRYNGKGLNVGSHNFIEYKLLTANQLPYNIKYRYIKILLQ